MNYIVDLLGDVKNAAERGSRPAVHYACKLVVPELRQLDSRDFMPEVRADFVRLTDILESWSQDINSVNVKKRWAEIEPPLANVLNNYAGEGSRGDPEFKKKQNMLTSSSSSLPTELTNSLPRFREDHPDPNRCAFIMMQCGNTNIHREITQAIKDTLATFGIEGLRADDKDYHDDLFPNVLTYIHGCSFGIAVFERLEDEIFNPNVALAVGYMRALKKPLCLMKDQTLKTLQTDLVGKLYKNFDTHNVRESTPPNLRNG